MNPYDKAVVWAYRGGEWIELESKVRGQYLQVDMIGTKEVFCLESKDLNLVMVIGGAVAGAAVLAIAVVILKGGRKRRKSQRSRKPDSEKK